ncbi:FYN-binding protein-like [Arapaima gigas]
MKHLVCDIESASYSENRVIMSDLTGAAGSEAIVSTIKERKIALESNLGNSLQKAHKKAQPGLKLNSPVLKPGPQFQKPPLENSFSGVAVLPKVPSGVSKPSRFSGGSKSSDNGANDPTILLKPTPNSKMKSSVVAAETQAQVEEAQKQFTKGSKDTTSESCKKYTKIPSTVPLVSGLPKPPIIKKASCTVQTTCVVEKAPVPGSQGPVDDPSMPVKKPLPNIFVLGSPSPKPERPPIVNLKKFTVVKGCGNDDPLQKWAGSTLPNLLHGPHKRSLVTAFSSQAPGRNCMMMWAPQTFNYPPPLPSRSLCTDWCNNAVYTHTSRRVKPLQYVHVSELWSHKLFSLSPRLRNPIDKHEVMDVKKQQKCEKEEKEFRKKFKFEGKIKVLSQVAVIPLLTCKKLGNKDLPLKPGEMIDIISGPVGNKLIGRNQDGKFGYVSTSDIVPLDEIYDDVNEGYIYDND